MFPTPLSRTAQIACGGKRAGHWCCATAASGAVNCWGAGNADYVPASSGTLSTTSPWAMSAGCDFVCILNADGSVTMEGGRSGNTCGWNGASHHPREPGCAKLCVQKRLLFSLRTELTERVFPLLKR